MNSSQGSRRSFLKRGALAAASLAVWQPALGQDARRPGDETIALPGRPFEVDGSTYPWEVHDEGIEVILDNMTDLAGINTVYLIALMHHERRPFTSKQFPHNPVRAEWQAEDSCVYFHPHLELYGRIKPALSQHEWLRATDWLKVVVDAARARGMKVGVEISHTPIPASVLKANPEFQQRDLNHKPQARLCPNHPDVREYLLALFGDLARHYRVDFIQTCMLLYAAGGPPESTCFCESCQREARAAGFDLAAAIPMLKANPQAQPQLDQWRTFKRNSTARIYRLIVERIHREKPGLEFRWNDTLPYRSDVTGNPAVGLYPEDLKGVISSCVLQSHTEQNGKPNETFSHRSAWIAANRSALGAETPLYSGIAVRPKATPALIRKGIQAAVAGGVNGIACKHYDGATYSMLRAVRAGLCEAGVKGFSPALGIEAGSMTLQGYVPDTYLDESCIKTAGVGTALATFKQPPGIYDVIVSYAGGPGGQGNLAVSVGGREVLSWPLHQAVGCWQRKTLPRIPIQSGDEIKLTGVAGGAEGARVEFIEFVPRNLRNKDRAMGAFLGAAIGDAMGGPVENWSADRIKKEHGEIRGFLPNRV